MATATKVKKKAAKKVKTKTKAKRAARTAEAVSAAVDPGRFEQIPLRLLTESPTNPRKTFSGIEELAESIKAHGVLEPVIVRPSSRYVVQDGHTSGKPCFFYVDRVAEVMSDPFKTEEEAEAARPKFELIAGARRFRASQLAGAETIPAIVRDLDDRAVLEIQVIENDQREDVHPMDQAAGYQLLIEQAGYDVASLAAKIGRDETYVYRRLQLMRLVPELQEMLRNGDIHFGHALELARITEADQRELLKPGHGSLIGHDGGVRMSVKDLREAILRNFHLDLADAPFPTDDAGLVEGVVACTGCSKRTGFNKSLFPDVDNKDTCTDRACFDAKTAAFVQIRVTAAKEKHGEDVILVSSHSSGGKGILPSYKYELVSKREQKDVPPEELKTAVIAEGDGLGKVVTIRVRGKETSTGGVDPEQQKKEREEQQKREAKANALEALHTEVLRRAINAADGDPPVELLRAVAAAILNDDLFYSGDDVFDSLLKECLDIEPPKYGKIGDFVKDLDLTQLHKFFLLRVGVEHYEVSSHDPKTPPEIRGIAEAYGIDLAVVRKELKAKGGGDEAEDQAGDE